MLYPQEAEFIQSLLSVGKKQLTSLFNLTYRYIDDVLSIIIQTLIMIWVWCISLSLRSKISNWIYSCRSGRKVSFESPFTTNMTISTSILQTVLFLSSNIRSSPAIRDFISQLIHVPYTRASSFYEYFILRSSRLSY